MTGLLTTKWDSDERVEIDNSVMTPRDRLLTVQDLAAYLGVPATTLYQWRYRREGPRGVRVGRHIRYQWTDVAEWIENQKKADR